MKKIFVMYLVVCLLFALSGCGRSESYNTCSFCGEQILESARFCSQCGEEVYESDKPVDYTILDLGTCNANVSWEIRSNGTLYIYGKGTIPGYSTREVDGIISPWRASAVFSQITDVLIGDGITGIGENAFDDMKLTSINFGHSMVAYKRYIFTYQVKIAYIPATMKDIASFLYNTNGLETVYYEGTQEEWAEICGKYGDYVIHYDCEY